MLQRATQRASGSGRLKELQERCWAPTDEADIDEFDRDVRIADAEQRLQRRRWDGAWIRAAASKRGNRGRARRAGSSARKATGKQAPAGGSASGGGGDDEGGDGDPDPDSDVDRGEQLSPDALRKLRPFIDALAELIIADLEGGPVQ